MIFGRERYVNNTMPLFTLRNETAGNGMKVSVSLKNCTIDYLSTAETKSLTLFDLAENADSVLSVRFEGGSIKLSSILKLPIFNGKSDERIVFAKDENGKRALFKLTDDEAPDLVFNTDDGEMNLKFIERERVHFTRFTYYSLST